MKRLRPKGSAQHKLLSMLVDNNGYWHKNCGWLLSSQSETIRVLETLVKRGDVVITHRRNPRLNGVIDVTVIYRLPWMPGV